LAPVARLRAAAPARATALAALPPERSWHSATPKQRTTIGPSPFQSIPSFAMDQSSQSIPIRSVPIHPSRAKARRLPANLRTKRKLRANWSRKKAAHRCRAPDHIGSGRESDKHRAPDHLGSGRGKGAREARPGGPEGGCGEAGGRDVEGHGSWLGEGSWQEGGQGFGEGWRPEGGIGGLGRGEGWRTGRGGARFLAGRGLLAGFLAGSLAGFLAGRREPDLWCGRRVWTGISGTGLGRRRVALVTLA
jgi:hypothetical protein